MLIPRIVREAFKLSLNRLREGTILDYTVLRCLARELGIEVRDIEHALHIRLERGLDLASEQAGPVDVPGEEGVTLDVVRAASAKALLGVALEECGHDATCVGADIGWEVERVREDALIHDVHVLVIEGRKTSLQDDFGELKPRHAKWNIGTNEHLVKEDTKGPPVDSLGVPLALKQLRRNIFRGSTEC
jgi:hypothetical protein